MGAAASIGGSGACLDCCRQSRYIDGVKTGTSYHAASEGAADWTARSQGQDGLAVLRGADVDDVPSPLAALAEPDVAPMAGKGSAKFRRDGWRRWGRRILVALSLFVLLPYLLVLVPPYRAGRPISLLMVGHFLGFSPVERTWRPLEDIAPILPLTVISSEDARFCSHRGVDWEVLQKIIDDAQDGDVSHGGSTITQQVAKNLFLWPGRSYLRKALEIPLALWIDLTLPKRRILEIYLNIAEWGPKGQFGAEAAAQYAFGHGADRLTRREAAQLAAILPNPVRRSARQPGPAVRRISATYMARAASSPQIDDCLRDARQGRW